MKKSLRNKPLAHILIVIKNYDGGTGTFANLLAKHLPKKSTEIIKVTIICLSKPRWNLPKHTQVIIYPAKNIYSYSLLKTLIRIPQELFWLRKQLTTIRPDVVLAVDLHSIAIVEFFHSLNRYHFWTIANIHNNVEKVLKLRVGNKIIRWIIQRTCGLLLARSTVVVTISTQLSNQIQTVFGLSQAPKTIPNGVSISSSFPYRPSASKYLKLLAAGRLEEQKDFETIIQAVKECVNERVPIKLTIIGSGEKKPILNKIIENNDLSDHVIMRPWSNLEKEWDRHDVFVLSSKWEGLPYVLLESMAHGLPTFASDCDFGPREIYQSSTSKYLYPPGDYHKLAQRLRWFFKKDAGQRLSIAQSQFQMAKRYQVKNQVEMFKKLIQQTTPKI